MSTITTPLAPMGLFAVVYLGMIFANLSRRLNSVTRRKKYDQWFAVANILIAVAAISQMIRGSAALACRQPFPILLHPWFAMVSFHIPLAIGVTIDLVLVWYYWAWILKEDIE